MARRIKKAKITHISLVQRGANQVGIVYKSDGADGVRIDTIVKYDDEQGLLTALVYPAERFDSDDEIASAEVVKDMAHEFIPNGAMIDVDHDLQALPRDKAHVAETFIVQKGDPRFKGWKDYSGEPIDATGGWGTVIKLNDPDLRAKARSGEFGGVSMYGKATFETIKNEDIPNALARRLSGTPKETDMTEEQMAKLLEKQAETLVKSLGEVLAKALKPDEENPDDKITKVEFEGDPTNVEDVAKHADKVFLASCDLSTPEGVAKWQKFQADKAAALKKAETETDEAKATALKELEKSNPELAKAMREKAEAEERIAKLEKGSNADAGTEDPDEGLSKMQKGMKRGREIAKAHNDRRDVGKRLAAQSA